VMAFRGRVAEERRLDVLLDQVADIGKFSQQLDGLLLRERFEVDGPLLAAVFVAAGAEDLLGQLVVQAVDEIADVVFDVAQVQVLPSAVARVHDLQEIIQDFDDGVAARQRSVAQMVEPAALGVRADESFDDFRQGFFESQIGGHEDIYRGFAMILQAMPGRTEAGPKFQSPDIAGQQTHRGIIEGHPKFGSVSPS